MSDPVLVYIEREEGVERPYQASAQSAGWDIRAAKDILLYPGETTVIPTGLRMALPKGYEAQIRPRSGLSLRTRLRMVNSPGTIDADYRDELGLIVHNHFSQAELPLMILRDGALAKELAKPERQISLEALWKREKRSAPLPEPMRSTVVYLDEQGQVFGSIQIKAGERIAQLVIAALPEVRFLDCEDVRAFGEDRGGGFGHSGLS